MNPAIAFKIASTLVIPAWLFLIFAPNTKLTEKLVKSGLVSMVLSVGYFTSLGLGLSAFQNGGGFNSLDEVRLLFHNDWALLAGWIHYLAFDLLIGVKMQSELKAHSRILVGPILFAIFMFGPAGYLLGQVARKITTKKDQ